MTDQIQQRDIQKWIDLLRSSVSTDRLEGATELASLAVRTRSIGAVRSRGTITRAAHSRMPDGINISTVMAAFNDEHVEVRRTIAFNLGELADESVVKILKQITECDSDVAVRCEAIDALGKIGGQHAVGVIKNVISSDPSIEVRIRGIRALVDLARAEPEASSVLIETLEKAMSDPEESVKMQAETALAAMK
jgi:HEAT repeat protein